MKFASVKNDADILSYTLRAIAYLGIGCLLFAVITFVFIPFEYDKDSDYVRSNKSLLGAINRWQQLEHLETQEFNTNFSEFANLYKLEVNKQLSYYDYIVRTENNLALIYSLPKQDYEDRKIFNITIGKNRNKPFYSYVGAAYVRPTNKQSSLEFNADNIICKSNSIGSVLPEKPILQEGTLSCNPSTHKIQ